MLALSIRTRLILGFSLMAASFVVVAVLAAYNGLRASEAEARTQHLYRVINASDEMMLGVANMQAGLRGYLLTGVVAELDAYRLGAITFEQAWTYAHDLTEGDARQQERLARIRAEAASEDDGGAGRASCGTALTVGEPAAAAPPPPPDMWGTAW